MQRKKNYYVPKRTEHGGQHVGFWANTHEQAVLRKYAEDHELPSVHQAAKALLADAIKRLEEGKR